MPENPRIEDLRRRVQKDPASIAFAQLAEEYRRAGQHHESVEACRAGLALHPGYLSARVTLGRALLELGELEDAETELGLVLKSAPENLAAIRGIADIQHRRGNLAEALQFYQRALGLARNDPDLEEIVSELTQQLKPTKRSDSRDGLSLDDMHRELTARVQAVSGVRPAKPAPPATVAAPPAAPKAAAPPPSPSTPAPAAPKIVAAPPAPPPAAPKPVETPVAPKAAAPPPAPAATKTPAPPPQPTSKPVSAFDSDATIDQKAPTFLRRTAPAPPPTSKPAPAVDPDATIVQNAPTFARRTAPPPPASKPAPAVDSDATIVQNAPTFLRRTAPPPAPVNPGRERALKTVAALEKWLDAINVTRAPRVS